MEPSNEEEIEIENRGKTILLETFGKFGQSRLDNTNDCLVG